MDRKALNQKHLHDPQPGDYWEDHFVGVCVVLGVSPYAISICTTKIDVDEASWKFDLSKIENKTPAEFRKWLSYDCIPGTWADVHPERHVVAVEREVDPAFSLIEV